VKYLLVILEVLSKKMHVVPLKNKWSSTVAEAAKPVIEDMKYVPYRCQTDKGDRNYFIFPEFGGRLFFFRIRIFGETLEGSHEGERDSLVQYRIRYKSGQRGSGYQGVETEDISVYDPRIYSQIHRRITENSFGLQSTRTSENRISSERGERNQFLYRISQVISELFQI
jgi:hypothetical protein